MEFEAVVEMKAEGKPVKQGEAKVALSFEVKATGGKVVPVGR